MALINLNGKNQNSCDVMNLNGYGRSSRGVINLNGSQKRPPPEIMPKPSDAFNPADGKNYDKAVEKFSKLKKGMANKVDALDKAKTVYDLATALQTPPSDLTPGGIAAYYAKIGLILAPWALPLVFRRPPSFAVATGFSVLTELASEDVQRMVYQSTNGLFDLGGQIASGIKSLLGGEGYQGGGGFSIPGFNFFTGFPNSKLWLGLGESDSEKKGEDPFGRQIENQIRTNIRNGLISSPNLYPGSYDQMPQGSAAQNSPPMNSSRNMPMPMPGASPHGNNGSSGRDSSTNAGGADHRADRPGMGRERNDNNDAARGNPSPSSNPDNFDVRYERRTYTYTRYPEPIYRGIENPGQRQAPIRPEVVTVDTRTKTTTNKTTGETKVEQQKDVYNGPPKTNTGTNFDKPATNSNSSNNKDGTTSGGNNNSGGASAGDTSGSKDTKGEGTGGGEKSGGDKSGTATKSK